MGNVVKEMLDKVGAFKGCINYSLPPILLGYHESGDNKTPVYDYDACEVVITGSLALALHGFSCRAPHDVDLIVVAKPEHVTAVAACLNAMRVSDVDEKRPVEYSTEKGFHAFNFNETVFNVWLKTPESFAEEFKGEEFLTIHDGLKVNSVMNILRKKASYKRSKDYQDATELMNMITKIFLKTSEN